MRNAYWPLIVQFLTVLGLLANRAAAREIYVNNLAGDDKNTGLHAQTSGDTMSPVRTIAKRCDWPRAVIASCWPKARSRTANVFRWSAAGIAGPLP